MQKRLKLFINTEYTIWQIFKINKRCSQIKTSADVEVNVTKLTLIVISLAFFFIFYIHCPQKNIKLFFI